jgi:hypothetical protein
MPRRQGIEPSFSGLRGPARAETPGRTSLTARPLLLDLINLEKSSHLRFISFSNVILSAACPFAREDTRIEGPLIHFCHSSSYRPQDQPRRIENIQQRKAETLFNPQRTSEAMRQRNANQSTAGCFSPCPRFYMIPFSCHKFFPLNGPSNRNRSPRHHRRTRCAPSRAMFKAIGFTDSQKPI